MEKESVIKSIEKAHKVVEGLCNGKNWIMHVPAREDSDPDLVINRALCDAEKLINELTRNSQITKEESPSTSTNNRSDVISLIQSAIEDVEGCAEYESPGETTVGKLNAAIAKLSTCG